MQLFLWQFPGDEKIRTFCMTRLVMGNTGSPSLSIVSVHETAELGDNRSNYPVAYNTLKKNSYVDNVCRVAPDIDTIKRDIEEIEKVSAMGGFHYKEWVISGQDVTEQLISVQLPNQIGADEERCLGVSWDVKNDDLFIKSNLDKPGKKTRRMMENTRREIQRNSGTWERYDEKEAKEKGFDGYPTVLEILGKR